MIARKVKINLKDIQQSPDYNILYNQVKIKIAKIKVIILKYINIIKKKKRKKKEVIRCLCYGAFFYKYLFGHTV